MQINIIFMMTFFSICLCGGCGKKGSPESPNGAVFYTYPPLDHDCCESKEDPSLPCFLSEDETPCKTCSVPHNHRP